MPHSYLTFSDLQGLNFEQPVEVKLAQLLAALDRLRLKESPLCKELEDAMKEAETNRPKSAVCYDETPEENYFLLVKAELLKKVFNTIGTITYSHAFKVENKS